MGPVIRTILATFGLICWGYAASAQSVLHKWPVTGKNEFGTVLTAQGSATGRGLTATISPPMSFEDRDVTEVFDAEIDRQMAGKKIIARDDYLRLKGSESFTLVTKIEYQPKASSRRKRITFFSARGKTKAEVLRLIRADGPFDRRLMEHYSSDVYTITSSPDVAIAEAFTIRPHPGQAKKKEPVAKTKTAPPKRSTTTAFKPPAQPRNWTRKIFSDAADYQPTTGALAKGSKNGFFRIIVYNPIPLNGRPIDDFLYDFARAEERDFDIRSRETPIMDSPHRAWYAMQRRNKNGVFLTYSYLAIRTGQDSVRIVRETLIDKAHKKRMRYARGIEQLYRHIENETEVAYRVESNPAKSMHIMTKVLQTESNSDWRKRQRRAKASKQAKLQNRVTSKAGKGIPNRDVAGVFLRSDFLERSYGGKDADVSVYILLKDGTAYRNPTRPPSDLNVRASRQAEASQWMQWRRSGQGYQVRANRNAPWKRIKGRLAKPAPAKTMAFVGNHLAAWGDVLSGSAGHRSGKIILTRGGRFETESFALAGGSGITGLPSATVSRSTGRNGRQSTTSSSVAPALINNTKRDPNGTDFTGQYALNGFTAEFLSDSGKLNRTLFLITQNGVYVSGRYYSAPKK